MAEIHIAAKKGDFCGVKKELMKGVSINLRERDEGYTPLHYACRNGHYRIAKYLISNGADVLLWGKKMHYETPLECAIRTGHTRLVKMAINICLEMRPALEKVYILERAIAYRRKGLVDFLLKKGTKRFF